MSGTIGLSSSSGFFTNPPPTTQQLMNGSSGGAYTAVSGDIVTQVAFYATAITSGGLQVAVGVYDASSLALLGSGTGTSIQAGGNVVTTVSIPLVAGHTYVIGYSVLANPNGASFLANNTSAGAGCITNGVTGGALQNPFGASTGTNNHIYNIWATVTNSGPSQKGGMFFADNFRPKIPAVAAAMFMPLSWSINRRNKRAAERRKR